MTAIKKLILLFYFIIVGMPATSAQEISIIPKPQEISKQSGEFNVNEKTHIKLDGTSETDISLFTKQLRKATSYDLPFTDKADKNVIVFQIDSTVELSNNEGYILNISKNKVVAKAKTTKGIFYATQSLRQLLPLAIDNDNKGKTSEWVLPAIRIKDYPRYDWRGYMQDVSRTFYDVEVIKKYLDLMALYKMNTFHWHLTDDQGWRIEIKKYPELTSKLTTQFHRTEDQPSKRSGYYTQDEIKEIVNYAKKRHITIVPEIDVPGHSWPTILAYKNLGVNAKTYPHYVFPFVSSWGYWGNQFTPNTLDPTKEEVYTFLKDIFTEVADLFPGKYIHFGGDEVQHEIWEDNAHVKQFIEDKGLSDVEGLQSYFVQRVSSIIEDLGKTPIGWNDILADDENLPNETAIMSWSGEEGMKKATQKGFDAVATPSSHVYLDITQANRNDGTPSDLAYPNINSIDRIYDYNPSKGLTGNEKEHVLGVQANMWTALAQEVKAMNVQVFPRLLAVSEVGWTLSKHKDFERFKHRLQREEKRLDQLKVAHYTSGGFIVGTWTEEDVGTDEDYTELSFDVTDKVYANGHAVAGFLYTAGDSFLEIDQVKLYEDHKLISQDCHHALADDFRGTDKVKPFYYHLNVEDYKPDKTYTIKAKVRGASGTDSEGNFTFNLNPYKSFTAVEQ